MPGQAYGYEECEDGTLKKQDPPDKDKSIGPAFYNPTVVRLIDMLVFRCHYYLFAILGIFRKKSEIPVSYVKLILYSIYWYSVQKQRN